MPRPYPSTAASVLAGLMLSACTLPALDPASLTSPDPIAPGVDAASPPAPEAEIVPQAVTEEVADTAADGADLPVVVRRGPAASYLDEPPSTGLPRSLWNRVREGFALADVETPRIDAELRWYASHPEYLDRVVERARPFLHLIVERIEERGLPTELALLPVVESAFNVFAYSPGRAAGIWQFIPATGKRFGLKQNWWYDGRRDVLAATDAAIDYLSELHDRFDGDWLHALASYNAGSGNVARAIRKNRKRGKPTDFWHLDVPRETRGYVPRLLALRRVVADPAAFGVTLGEIPDLPVLGVTATDGQLDLAVAADLAGLEIDELYRLNPGFNRWATDPAGPHRLLLPLANVPVFESGLQQLPASERLAWERHRVRGGETLSHIAVRYRTTVGHLRAINNLRGNTIRQGHHLLVPKSARARTAYALSSEQRRARTQAKVRKGKRVEHVVRSGDTLWDLSRQYRVSTARLAAWNGLSVRDPIRPGQSLVIWVESGAAANAPAAPSRASLSEGQAVQRINYVVRRGDSLSRIASRFNVSLNDLKRWNERRLNGKYLQPGQSLQLYVDVRRQSS